MIKLQNSKAMLQQVSACASSWSKRVAYINGIIIKQKSEQKAQKSTIIMEEIHDLRKTYIAFLCIWVCFWLICRFHASCSLFGFRILIWLSYDSGFLPSKIEQSIDNHIELHIASISYSWNWKQRQNYVLSLAL